MAFVDDLVEQAECLLEQEKAGRPRQASLRRAVSAAYYSVFHETIDQAVRSILLGEQTSSKLRSRLERTITHGAVKQAATWITTKNTPLVFKDILSSSPPGQDLKTLCSSLIVLQNQRHRAD